MQQQMEKSLKLVSAVVGQVENKTQSLDKLFVRLKNVKIKTKIEKTEKPSFSTTQLCSTFLLQLTIR